MKAYRRMGSGCTDPHFLDLGTSWRWVINFSPRPLYPQGKSHRYPLDRRLGGPQSRSERFGEEKILDPTGTRTPTPRSSKPVAMPTTLSRLLVGGCTILKWILERDDGMVWIGLMWLEIWISGRLLWTRYWTFGFHEMFRSSWVAAQLAAPQEGLSSVSK
jgi:hypothetical protein